MIYNYFLLKPLDICHYLKSVFAVLESGRNISPVEHNGGHSSKQNCMYCRWLQYNFIDLKCFN